MRCHDSQRPIFKIGKTEIYGGGIDDEPPEVDVIIELNQPYSENCIFVEIKDFSVPDLPKEFWQEL